ncbi:ABC-type antimicrobial peptide transport system permease subunit [Neomicrococcus aestuarii]|uniref:ABC-type antimicrobial peptide transport system permease subunit n=1 Tax=Neomicrococcus aestuarii TaxID=556325 RepID=A0A7W8X1L7_9MICC|nr:ABC transporter permease [Neomicrococcus aestuarii]MBB5512929.1 ABC-type antimicrobial peptide transport system permease subunit [Neomicrococcus aestuarii]
MNYPSAQATAKAASPEPLVRMGGPGKVTALESAVPDSTISTQSELASQVSSALASASSLISNLGTWFSIAVLAVALLIAMLLTSSGVARRTREFGTLKALGWSNNRVVAQVAGESMIQSIIGGIAGLALGLGAVAIIYAIGPTISDGGTTTTPAGGQGAPRSGVLVDRLARKWPSHPQWLGH